MSTKDVKKLVARVAEQGWRVEDRGTCWMALSPDGVTKVTIHKTNSDHRAIKNIVSRLRKGGFKP